MRSPEEALKDIKGYAGAGRVAYTRHGYDRLEERNVTEDDVLCALKKAADCTEQEDETWRVNGPDMEGDELTVIVVIESGLLVVTVF